MNSMARSLALRVLHRLQRPAAATAVGKQAAAAAAYSTADRLAAYRYYKTDAGYLLVPLVAIGAGTWLIATAATRYLMTPPRQGTAVVEGPRTEVSPSN